MRFKMARGRNRRSPRLWRDMGRCIHYEIDRLPERHRIPVVLCDLEGRSHEEAARYLRCPVGTVKSRLARALASGCAPRSAGED